MLTDLFAVEHSASVLYSLSYLQSHAHFLTDTSRHNCHFLTGLLYTWAMDVYEWFEGLYVPNPFHGTWNGVNGGRY